MTITYPINFPTGVYLNAFSCLPRNAVSRTESPFSFVEQVYDFGGEGWEVQATLPLMTREVAEEYLCFILKLKGRKGTFLLPVPESTPRGAWTGTPLVKGAGQTGNSLLIDGLALSTTGICKAGDWINLGSSGTTRLHKVLEDANSNGAGEATLTIWPSLRSSPADNAAVTVTNCKGLFRLKEDTPFSLDVNKHYLIEFSAFEAISGA